MTTFFTLITLAADPAHADSGGGANIFAGTIAQSIAAIIVFLLLLTLLWKYAWGPILKGLQDRENKIKADLEHAERASREAAATLEQYKRQLADAQVEAGKLIAAARTDAEKTAAQIREQTQNEINAMKQRATADIAAARQDAVAEVYAHVATISTQIASRILRRQINAADQQALIDQSLAELRAANVKANN